MAIKEDNIRVTITLSKEDYLKLCAYSDVLDINCSRLISKFIHLYCVVDLRDKI